MVDLLLFPSSFFSVKRVDEDLQMEYEAAKATGLYDVILYGYDKWVNEGLLTLSETPSVKRKAIMRGWMLKPEQYRNLFITLIDNNIELTTTPDEYERMHIFPNVYDLFGSDAALMKIYPLHEQIDVEELKKAFSRFMIKDYVKSIKGTVFPKYFDSSISQHKFDECMEFFYKYRGDLLTGGICVKEYLDLKYYGNNTNEYRAFYADNEIVTISRNSGQPVYASEPPRELIEKYKNLPSCYYTVDYAELSDGSWKVIEAGDGSVSGLSGNQDAEHYYRALYYAWNK